MGIQASKTTGCSSMLSHQSNNNSAKTPKSASESSAAESTSDSQIRQMELDRPSLSEEQVRLVLETWKIVQEDMSKVGIVLFMNLFETHPEVQGVFIPFKGLSKEDLRYSKELKAHALRVMQAVEKCLARIEDPNKLIKYLHELGNRHVAYNVKVDYIDLIGPQFLGAIEPTLREKDRWTPEVEQAWSDLFDFVSHVLKEAMQLC